MAIIIHIVLFVDYFKLCNRIQPGNQYHNGKTAREHAENQQRSMEEASKLYLSR